MDYLFVALYGPLLYQNFWIMILVNLDTMRFLREFYRLLLLNYPEFI